MQKLKKLVATLLMMGLIITLMPSTQVAAKDEDSVAYQTVDSVDSLQNFIDSDGAYSSQDTISTAWKGNSGLHKISVDEDGWIFIRGYSNDDYEAKILLYSNFACTNQIGEAYCSKKKEENLVACYVKAGNYYYITSRWNGYEVPMINTCYVGFLPAKDRIQVDKITYSKDHASAVVTFDYDEDYLGSFLDGTIRVIKKDVAYTDIQNNDLWKSDSRENALEKNSFKVTANGTYTARIAGSDKYFAMCTFEIDGIKDANPAKPKIASYQKGSDTISGTAAANTKVIVKVSGKSYTATVNDAGKWEVSTNSNLKKGQKITAYVKTSAGTKSKVTSVVVK
ncbi:Ig-like domain-containing protein [Anaeromicropila herbilytica]|uniref:Bacterial Ig domain-containing protein n=1 Tax=Anaeromicropila herbilytica TaxID=2785025 RepID=A0A7R7EHN5_9FIRM|nr:Ig-like domain-containing protein [Anaeromicropila herbilytica]BCN29410.1 hypothetical protein bsdtb5_07050 [Anaeromicropila herbilytica]